MKFSKKMTIVCATLIIALFSVTSIFAQGRGMMDTAAMRQRQEARLAKMKTDLNLTQVQADSMRAITMEFGQKRRDIFMDPANQGMSREDRMAKMQPLMDAQNARIQAVLGADLYKSTRIGKLPIAHNVEAVEIDSKKGG